MCHFWSRRRHKVFTLKVKGTELCGSLVDSSRGRSSFLTRKSVARREIDRHRNAILVNSSQNSLKSEKFFLLKVKISKEVFRRFVVTPQKYVSGVSASLMRRTVGVVASRMYWEEMVPRQSYRFPPLKPVQLSYIISCPRFYFSSVSSAYVDLWSRCLAPFLCSSVRHVTYHSRSRTNLTSSPKRRHQPRTILDIPRNTPTLPAWLSKKTIYVVVRFFNLSVTRRRRKPTYNR